MIARGGTVCEASPWLFVCAILGCAILGPGCGSGGGGPSAVPEDLSGWGFFRGSGLTQEPLSERTVPFEVIATLFQDGAGKYRFMHIPEGASLGYTDGPPWSFPEGAVLIKTFKFLRDLRDPSLGERLIETRLLVEGPEGLEPHVYLWNDAQTRAVRTLAGARVPVSFTDAEGRTRAFEYRVPNLNQCRGCHGGTGEVEPLGPKTRQMDRAYDYGEGADNQIDHLAALGFFDQAPTPEEARVRMEDPFGRGPLEDRARSYLDANCAHCHRPGGSAGSSGLWLAYDVTDEVALGVCRRPGAAGAGTGGRSFDIVPGFPDDSIMLFRMESEEPGIKMPELPAVTSDAAGVALIREWIAAMEPTGCN